MRVRVLLGVLLFIFFLVVGAAAASSDAEQGCAVIPPRAFTLQPSGNNATGAFSLPTESPKEFAQPGGVVRIGKLPRWAFDRNLLAPGGTECYTMRTYKVERVDNTDITRPAGYSTCLPSSKVQMKRGLRIEK